MYRQQMPAGITGLLGAQPGSQNEWNAFGNAGFDQLSNEGITGSMSGNTQGMTMGNMLGQYLAKNGIGGGGGYSKRAYQQGLSSGPGGPNDASNKSSIQQIMQMAMANQQQPQQPRQQSLMGSSNPYVMSLMYGMGKGRG